MLESRYTDRIYSFWPILDDVLESPAETNDEAKEPKCPSRRRDREVLGKEKCESGKRNVQQKVIWDKT